MNRTPMKKNDRWFERVHWSLYAAIWIGGLIAMGTVLGMILFPLGGLVVGAERTPLELLVRGAKFGSFWFLLWAPAIAITATVMRAYRQKHPHAEQR